MKKFRKKLVSVVLSTGIALGGVATCNLCTKTSCSAITPEEIAQLVKEDVGVAQLVEEIRQQDFYNKFKGKSGRENKKKLAKALNRVKLGIIEKEATWIDIKRVIDNYQKALNDMNQAEVIYQKKCDDICRANYHYNKANYESKRGKLEPTADEAFERFFKKPSPYHLETAWKEKSLDELLKDISKSMLNIDTIVDTLKQAKNEFQKALAEYQKLDMDLGNVNVDDWINKLLEQYQDFAVALVSFISSYSNISNEIKVLLTGNLIDKLDFMLYIIGYNKK